MCAGIVTFWDAASSGNALANIDIGKLAPNYRVIRFYPTPTEAIEYVVDAELKIVTLDDTGDIPVLPEEFHDVLTAHARMKEYEHQNDQRLQIAREEYDRRMEHMKYRANVQFGQQMVVGGARFHRGISRTGGMFPVDTF